MFCFFKPLKTPKPAGNLSLSPVPFCVAHFYIYLSMLDLFKNHCPQVNAVDTVMSQSFKWRDIYLNKYAVSTHWCLPSSFVFLSLGNVDSQLGALLVPQCHVIGNFIHCIFFPLQSFNLACPVTTTVLQWMTQQDLECSCCTTLRMEDRPALCVLCAYTNTHIHVTNIHVTHILVYHRQPKRSGALKVKCSRHSN